MVLVELRPFIKILAYFFPDNSSYSFHSMNMKLCKTMMWNDPYYMYIEVTR